MAKKWYSLVLVITIISLLAACGNNGSKSSSSTNTGGDTSAETSAADSYPEKNIEIIVPFSAGGVSDILTRSFVEAASDIIDTTITVKNVNGGSGTVGNYELVRAKPDGYTWLWAATGHLSSALHITPAEYTMDDYTIVNKVGDMAAIIVVPKNSPFQTLEDLINYAKENPGELTIGNAGEATVVAMLAYLLEDRTETKLQHVPFQGSGELLPAVLGGHVDAGIMNVPEVASQVKAGELRALAVLSENRVDLVPDVPTAAEAGVEGVSGGAGHFIIIPNNVDPAIVAKIDELTKKVYESDKFKQLMEQAGYQLGYKNADDARAEVQKWYEVTGEIYKKLGKTK
ncbi:tripartite tricarboxylate transporter substrate binding protein [Paenibacillus sp. TH7-28]